MIARALVDTLPLWAIFLTSVAVTFTSMEIGYLRGKRKRRKSSADTTIRAGPVAAATFSLLAFMLAITFGGVNSRLQEMKHVTLDEANAIGTTFLRADLLSAAGRIEVRELLQDYVDLRVEAARQNEAKKIAQAADELKKLQSILWSRTIANLDQQKPPTSIIQPLNKLIELNAKWVTFNTHYRLPGLIWAVLCGLAILAMAMGGYDAGTSDCRRVIAITLTAALAYSVVLMLLVAMDRPSQGGPSAAMINLQEDIRGSMRSES